MEVNPLKKFFLAIEFNLIQRLQTRANSDKEEMAQNLLLRSFKIKSSKRYLGKPMKMNLARKEVMNSMKMKKFEIIKKHKVFDFQNLTYKIGNFGSFSLLIFHKITIL